MRVVVAPLLVAVAALSVLASPVRAQGQPLALTESFRGPFQHAVVGSSLVRADGTVLSSGGATLTLPSGASLRAARLLWMGSRATPDVAVTLRRSDGTTQDVVVNAANACVLAESVGGLQGATYFQCQADVTSFLREGGSLSGRYELSNVQFDTAGPIYGQSADTSANIYAGGFALVVIYVDPADPAPRVVQVHTGLHAQFANTGFVRTDVATLPPLELAQAGGRITHVALEGDAEASGNERVDICRNACDPTLNAPANTISVNLITSVTNPAAGLFNETISSEFAGVLGPAAETNGFDLDTYDLLAAFNYASRTANQFFANTGQLHVATTTGADMVAHVLLVVEIAERDGDGDGLSDQEEIAFVADPERADTDDDGLVDGLEAHGGNPANPDDPLNRVTNPNNGDSDGDQLCDGNRSLLNFCEAGEDANQDGLRQATETDPLDRDSDDDLIEDGYEVLLGNYPGTADADPTREGSQTDPLRADSDGDRVLDGDEDLDHDGRFEVGETDPTQNDLIRDGDSDGINDDVERGETGGTNPTDPANSDTDGDGIEDGVEDADHNGSIELGETDPNSVDTDDDQLCDGGRDVTDVCVAGEDLNADGLQDPGETDPRDSDSDGDQIDDGTERLLGSYPGTSAESTDADPNREGAQTDPLNPDSDGDGVTDGDEDLRHDGDLDDDESDPTDPADAPGGRPRPGFDGGNEDEETLGRPGEGGCRQAAGAAPVSPLLVALSLLLHRRRR